MVMRRDGYDQDSVSAVLFMKGRYLLQHRENKAGVAYPDCWGLFGGSCDEGESAEDAVQRELLEEINLVVKEYELLLTCTYELWFEERRTRKSFFCLELDRAEADSLVLKEGQGMAWLGFHEAMARADRFVPFDLGILALHHRGQVGSGAPGRHVTPGTGDPASLTGRNKKRVPG